MALHESCLNSLRLQHQLDSLDHEPCLLNLLLNPGQWTPSQPFSPSRGIRQGDPLSPFLFFIMAEGLGHYIKASIQNGSLQGLPLHGLQPAASHSQFVDDTMLLNTPTMQRRKQTKLHPQ
jgi:hypothetical protein